MAYIFQSDGNYVNFNGGANLWRLHKDSNCISWHWDQTGDLFFAVYDNYYQVKAGVIGDVVIDGVPLSTASDFATAITAIFTGLEGGGGSSYLFITYAELVALINSSGLVAGTQYEISDFATVHYIVDANGEQYLGDIITGVTEPLIVVAGSVNTINKIARSTLYPQDIIYYDWDENNWLDDLSFADLTGAPVIVTGFKGVVYFRHDTILDNYCGYDFRNCKFRRWKTAAAAYNAGTSYSAGNIVDGGDNFIYRSLQSTNTNHTPASSPLFWVAILDLTNVQYWLNIPGTQRGIVAGVDFDDFKTFSEGTGSATYELSCRSNHFESFKDNNTYYDISGTLLSNNVIFLQDNGEYDVHSNKFSSEHFGNTFEGTQLYGNEIGIYFINNLVGINFFENDIMANFGGNIVGGNFLNNDTSENFNNNYIGSATTNNIIGASCSGNSWGSGFTTNDIRTGFGNNYIASDFKQNECLNQSVQNVDFTGATHVYAAYSCTLLLNNASVPKLIYLNNLTLTIAAQTD